ncbi:penicillin-binding protein 1A [soil metagenome]
MSQRSRRRHTKSKGSVGKKLLLVFGAVFAIIAVAVAGAALKVKSIYDDTPSIDTLKPLDSGASTQVFAADGSSLGYIQNDIIRTPVSLHRIPKTLQEGTISIEDQNFYEHGGIDYGAIVRAAVKNAEADTVRQGASTITQQLVRNLYIDNPEDTIERKIHEASLADQYEKKYSKNQILDRYLNTASYGTNDGKTAVGVEAASQVFFNKPVQDLNLWEAALLSGLPQAPSEYNPFTNAKDATKRRDEVLRAMQDQGYISRSEMRNALSHGLGLQRGYQYETRKQEYFFDFVQQELIDRYGLKTARQGGLRVYTTLDPKLQALAEQSIADHPVTDAAAALVSTDAQTGEIRAMASSTSYDDTQFNLAAQGKRQAGSSFKPFALAAAIADDGLDPDTTYYPAPSSITLDPGDGGPPWPVSGGEGASRVRDALVHSDNVVFAQLVLDIGPDKMDEMAHKLGITTKLFGYPSEVLGTTDVSVLEMSNAYASFANGGVHHDPTAIDKVVFPDNKVDTPEDTNGSRAISEGVAYEMEDVMKGVLVSGTAACCNIPCPAAGKTGTTEEQSDAWFVGYTPHVSTAVWVGNPNERIPLPGYGADLAAPIWQQYMTTATAKPCDDFPLPNHPADLSTFFGDHTASKPSTKDPNDPTALDTTTDTTTTTTTETTTGGGVTPDEQNFNPDLYAPGAGEGPAGGDNGN